MRHNTLIHGVLAAAMTALAFGVGPGIGWAVAGLDVDYELVQGPLEGDRAGTVDFASFELQLAPVDLATTTDEAGEAVKSVEHSVEELVESGEPDLAVLVTHPKAAALESKSLEASVVAEVQPVKAPKGRRCEHDESNSKIERTAKGEYDIERSLVTYYISHLRALNGLGWSARNKGSDGKSNGMKIGGVRCGNDLHLAGIRSGDVVHKVNGRKVTSITQAIFVYQKVRKDPFIEVELTRRGKKTVLRYDFS